MSVEVVVGWAVMVVVGWAVMVVVGWAVMVAADMPEPAGTAQAWEEEVEGLMVMAAPVSVVAPAEEAVMAVAPVGAA